MAGSVYSQEITVKATLDSNKIFVGDWVHLQLDVNKAKDVHIQLPYFEKSLSEGIEIIDQQVTDSSFSHMAMKYTITAYDSGLFYIPPIPVLFQLPNGVVDTIFTKASYLEVQPFYFDQLGEEIADINELQPVKFALKDFIWIIFVVIGLGILGGALHYFLFENRKKKGIVKSEPVTPPYIQATERLQKLEQEELWQQGKLKEYYTELTEVLRWYIEAQYYIPALEQTTEEIIKSVTYKGVFDADSIQMLKDLLPLADMVKFAKGTTDANENTAYLNKSKEFIDRTKVQLETPQEEKEDNHV